MALRRKTAPPISKSTEANSEYMIQDKMYLPLLNTLVRGWGRSKRVHFPPLIFYYILNRATIGGWVLPSRFFHGLCQFWEQLSTTSSLPRKVPSFRTAS